MTSAQSKIKDVHDAMVQVANKQGPTLAEEMNPPGLNGDVRPRPVRLGAGLRKDVEGCILI